jgi:signal transduction histidine kinase
LAQAARPDLSHLRRDAALGLLLGAAWWVAVQLALRWDYWRPLNVETYWLAGAWLVVPIALRRTAPGLAFWATTLLYPWMYLVWMWWGLQSAFHLLPILLAVFWAVRARAVRAWLAAPVASLMTLWLEWTTLDPLLAWLGGRQSSPGGNVTELLLLVTLMCAAAALGAVFARLDTTLASLAERNRELEELQEVRTREAVQSERVRIARDLHDVVAHHVSAIVVRAQAADRVGGDDVDVYRDAVRWIAPEGRTALDAMRSLVRVLREDAAPLAPTSTLADLGAVVERVRGAGLAVDARLPEAWPACPAPVGVAVVRVAQEALTNVVEHSRAGRASVHLAHDAGRLVLEVHDPGPPRPRTGERRGNGLTHMRERAAACGGNLTAGPCQGGGWTVRMEVAVDGRR